MDSLFEGEEPPLEKVRAVSSDMTMHYRALSASSDKMRRSGDGNDDFPGARLSSSDRRRGSSGGAGGDKAQMLVWSFCAMVVIGLGNKIFQKLETIPMYNYPNFLNLLTTAAYIPLSFAYVVPATRKGWIREDNFTVPKKDFAVMGFLDSVAGIMQVFAATYLPGSLLVLLLQSAIPVSMALSRGILKTRYHTMQYASAVVVMAGIVIVLAPSLFGASDDDDESGDTTVIWGLVLIASCVPMCLSSIYKEMSLGEVDLDPIYLNAW
jgi:drug/metabolite transporter (DMT)-like permease